MKKSVVITSTAASIGLATVLTFSAVAPSMAKTSTHSNTTKSASVKTTSSGTQGGVSFGGTQDTRKFTSVKFTVTNVPSGITDAATAAKLLVVKVVPLAADATAAPATAPLPTFQPKGDNDGDGPHGTWTPTSTTGTTSGTSSSTTSGTTTATPSASTAPTFGDNDGDGPAAGGHAFGKGHGKGGFGHGGPGRMQFSNLTLTNGTLTGTIQLPGDEVAGSQKFGIYLSIAADSTNGVTAQSSTPVMVTVTTAADLSASVTASTGDVTLAIK